MNMSGLEEDYERTDEDTFTFTFYKLEDMFDFLTEENNCMDWESKKYFIDWVQNGICTDILSEYTKNRELFYGVAFQNRCVLCNQIEIVDREDEDCPWISKMNPLKHKMVVEYTYSPIFNQYLVEIRIPMICRRCSPKPLSLPNIHDELLYKVDTFHEYCKMTCCYASTYIKNYYFEPFISKKIISYLNTYE